MRVTDHDEYLSRIAKIPLYALFKPPTFKTFFEITLGARIGGVLSELIALLIIFLHHYTTMLIIIPFYSSDFVGNYFSIPLLNSLCAFRIFTTIRSIEYTLLVINQEPLNCARGPHKTGANRSAIFLSFLKHSLAWFEHNL